MKTNSLFKRLVSMLIVVLMICTLFPVTALAENNPIPGALEQLLKVQIHCSNSKHSSSDGQYDLASGTYDIGEVTVRNGLMGVKYYAFTVTVHSAKYVEQYDNAKGATHTPNNGSQTVNLTLRYGPMSGWSVNEGPNTITFDVKCEDTIAAPNFDDLKRLLKVEIDCETNEDEHDDITYSGDNLIEDSFSVTKVDDYTYDVTVSSEKYIDAFDDTYKIEHSPEVDDDENNEEATVRLVYADGAWTLDDDYEVDDDDDKYEIEFDVVCDGASTPEPAVTGIEKEVVKDPTGLTNVPTGITYPNANNIATVPYGTTSVTLLYRVTVSGDAGASYSVTDTDATCISNNASGTIPQGGNAVLYFTKTFTGLTTGDNTCSNTAAVGNTNSNTVDVTVKVSAPEKPTEKYLEEELLANGAVKIHCTKDTDCNDDETYGLISSTYNIGNVETDTNTGEYTCTITVTAPAPYAEQYNSNKHSKGFTNEHTLCPDQGSKTIILEYNESTSKWNVKTDSAPVTFNVVCGDVPTEPEPPAKEYLEKLLASGAVTIDCVNSEVDHEDKTYGLLTGSYDIGKPQKYGETDVYTCEITVYAAPYVAQYSTDMNKEHSLADVGSKKVILVYNGDEWIVPPVELAAGDDFEYESAFPVTFNVVCKETPVTTYTVTYKDGVGGKVFKDDVHTVESGATTPAFVGGIPTRPGYVFVGWTPAVSKTVTGDATYTATWRKVKDTTVIEIGGGNSSSSSSKEENPNTGAPVFVGVSVGALAAAK